MRFFAGSLIAACLLAGFALVQASPVFAQTPPGFSKAFSPARIALGGISKLTFTIDNSANAVAVTGLAFFDIFPSGLGVVALVNAENTCGGTLVRGGDDDELTLTGGSVAAGQTCTIAVDVQAHRPGDAGERIV